MRVLIAEDDKKIARAIGALVKRWGHEVLLCEQGDHALQLLRQQAVDLLIVDWLIPGLNGTELVRALRADADLKKLNVLMISGKASKTDIIEAIQAGVDAFLAKPFTPEQLKEKIAGIRRPAPKKAAAPARADEGGEARQRFQQLFDGVDAGPAADNPLVLFGEEVAGPEDLLRPDQRQIARYLLTAIEVITAVNQEHPDLQLGYLLQNDARDLREKLRRPGTRDRVKLVLAHLSDDEEERFLMARLISINQKGGFALIFICDDLSTIPETHRSKFDKLGIGLAQRDQLDAERLRALISSHVLGRLQSTAQETLAPDEIRERILDDLDGLDVLPPLPRVYNRIQALSRTPGSDLQLWVRALKPDPVICAVILRHARSPLYGFHERVEEIDRALILLGKRVVRDLVASESIKRTFSSIEEQGFSLEDLWRHSVCVGFAAHILAFPLNTERWTEEQRTEFEKFQLDDAVLALLKKVDMPHRLRLNLSKENPFMAGMMHDIGKPVMAQAYPGLYPLLAAEMKRRDWTVPFTTAEREIAGGLTHTVVGELLGKHWDLDPPLRRVIQYHHQPDVDDPFSFLIGIADFIAHALYPFPKDAESPVASSLKNGSLREAEQFLPEGFFEQPLLKEKELRALALALQPALERLTEDMQSSIG